MAEELSRIAGTTGEAGRRTGRIHCQTCNSPGSCWRGSSCRSQDGPAGTGEVLQTRLLPTFLKVVGCHLKGFGRLLGNGKTPARTPGFGVASAKQKRFWFGEGVARPVAIQADSR